MPTLQSPVTVDQSVTVASVDLDYWFSPTFGQVRVTTRCKDENGHGVNVDRSIMMTKEEQAAFIAAVQTAAENAVKPYLHRVYGFSL